MPIPEALRLSGDTTLLTALADQQPRGADPPWNAATRHRQVTRTITLHFTHGWAAGNWQASGDAWFGASFNIDLDGTLYQCEEMIVRTNHVGGNPDFSGTYSFVNHTSIGIEIARFGRIQSNGGGYTIGGYPNINFQLAEAPPAECNYSQVSSKAGPRRFSLKKMWGGTTLRAVAANQNRYYLKAATFDDERNVERTTYPLDVLFTEEQYRTLVAWVKCMCEMHRIPKMFLRHPTTGREHPWIDVEDLIEVDALPLRRNENKERIKAFQGIIGHNNIQRDRADPGPSLDYYRIKRGISDELWYPVDLDDTTRAIDYLDTGRAADYMMLREYSSEARLDDYYAAIEGEAGGYFPIGLNRLWHGGIHLPSDAAARPVYAMGNGRVVAARVTNGTITLNGAATELLYSRCFILVRHEMHTRDSGDEIDYGDGSTTTVYSLYMHLAPLVIPEGEFAVDYAGYPIWFNHYMIDHPAAPPPRAGEVFFPDQPVFLSDCLGSTGSYIVGFQANEPRYGPTVHVEVFTTADVSLFAGSPWLEAANRVDDTTQDLVCDLASLDAWLEDADAPGIDDLDIRAAIPRMREIAIRHRSEWTLENRDQLSQEISAGQAALRVETAQIVSQEQWDRDIQPLCFYAAITSADAPSRDAVGPFAESMIVWHLHPLVFMRWMNRRVARHETIMRSQDKQYVVRSTVTVRAGYVVGFVSPVPVAPPAAGYPEVAWNDNAYGVNVNQLADRSLLAAAAQTVTRFHLRMLDVLDQINDRPHGLTVVLSYAAAAPTVHAARHTAGHAADLRPGVGLTASHWYNFFQAVIATMSYISGRDGESAVAMTMLQDPTPPDRPQAEATNDSNEWLRRLQAATGPADPALTMVDPAFPDLLAALGQMRIHLYIP